MQDFLFGFAQEMVTIRDYPILWTEDRHHARFFSGSRDFRLSDLQKRPLQEREELRTIGSHGRVDQAPHDFLRPAAGRDDTRSQFDQADICLRCGHHTGGMHGDLTTTTQD